MENRIISSGDNLPPTDGHQSFEPKSDQNLNEGALLAALRETQAAFQTAEPSLELEPLLPVTLEEKESPDPKLSFIPIIDNKETENLVVPNFLNHIDNDDDEEKIETIEPEKETLTLHNEPKVSLFQSVNINDAFDNSLLTAKSESLRPFSYEPSQQAASHFVQDIWLSPEQEREKLEQLTHLAKEGFNCIQQALRQGDTTTALELAEAFRTMPSEYDHKLVTLLIERLGIICYSNYYIARILNPYIAVLAQ
jgi:hypothetical protein